MRTRNKALAASFVMTFAAGCDSTTSQPPTAPTVDVAPNPPGPASAVASAQPTPSASAPPSTAPPLQPAPTVGRTEKQPDGTCMWFPAPCAVVNGRMLPCNPPRPHLVLCPPGDGGT